MNKFSRECCQLILCRESKIIEVEGKVTVKSEGLWGEEGKEEEEVPAVRWSAFLINYDPFHSGDYHLACVGKQREEDTV